MSILALADAKAHLRVTISDDDDLIQAKIDAAEAWIGGFLGNVALSTFEVSSVLPAPLTEATKQLVAYCYDNREASVIGSGLALIANSPGFYDFLAPFRTYVF